MTVHALGAAIIDVAWRAAGSARLYGRTAFAKSSKAQQIGQSCRTRRRVVMRPGPGILFLGLLLSSSIVYAQGSCEQQRGLIQQLEAQAALLSNDFVRQQVQLQRTIADTICALERSQSNSPDTSSSSRAPAGYVPKNGWDLDLEKRYCGADGSSAACCQQKQLSRDYFRRKGEHEIAEGDVRYIERHCRSRVQLRQDQGGVNVPPISEYRHEPQQPRQQVQEPIQWVNQCLKIHNWSKHASAPGSNQPFNVSYKVENTCSHMINWAVCTEFNEMETRKWWCASNHAEPGRVIQQFPSFVKMSGNRIYHTWLACKSSSPVDACSRSITEWKSAKQQERR